MALTLEQQRRYARQIMLPEFGEAGQEALLRARVLVIGAGGLGSALIPYLAAAGIGHLGIIDGDRVELSNLARQVIHETGDIGRLKVESAADRVSELNPDVQVTIFPEPLTAENAERIIAQYDVIADGCDNFKTRFVVNAACVKLGKPLVSAAISGFNGQVMSVANRSACYACFLHPDAPEANTCKESGVVGPLAGMIGSAQALEVVRMILGSPALVGSIAVFDGTSHQQRIVAIQKDVGCKVCG
ncbi:MAG: HesA/MoeB/ThiF family protein [Alphaproteobacteria bacterium]|nr:HesA/MoeB/ThiF family protein [Alphaproteobacteria bacterium]